MRGIAALAVVWLHAGFGFGLAYYPVHAALAVDFFFCLSGFVLAHAFEARLRAGLGFCTFAARRLIRLYPMLFAAGCLAVPAFYLGAPLPAFLPAALLGISVFTLIPFGLALHLSAYPLNTPVWSLFFEFVASAAYFVNARRGGAGPGAFAALAIGGICLVIVIAAAHGIDAIGVSSPTSFLDGFGRVFYAFFAGVLLYRLGIHRRVAALPAWMLVCGLAVLLCAPVPGWFWPYDAVAAIIVTPGLVAFGARVRSSGRLAQFCAFSGRLSYPLYVIHEPVLRAVYRLGRARLLLPEQKLPLAVLATSLAVVLSYALLRWYDEPLRRRLAAALTPHNRLDPGVHLAEPVP